MKLTLPISVTEADTNGVAERLEEVRRALTSETDNLTGVAGQLGHEIGTQAAKVGREASSAALPRIEQLLGLASLIGGRLLLVGRRSARDLGRDAKTIGSELRHVRLTTEPKRANSNLLAVGGFFGGLTAGLAAMWFLDPELGAKRRAAARDSIVGLVRSGRDRTAGVVRQAQTAIGRPLEITPDATVLGDEFNYGASFPATTPSIREEEPVGMG